MDVVNCKLQMEKKVGSGKKYGMTPGKSLGFALSEHVNKKQI